MASILTSSFPTTGPHPMLHSTSYIWQTSIIQVLSKEREFLGQSKKCISKETNSIPFFPFKREKKFLTFEKNTFRLFKHIEHLNQILNV